MRILLAHQSDPLASAGGSEVQVAAVARGFARDHEVAVLHPLRGLSPGETRERVEDGVRLLGVPHTADGGLGFESYRDPEMTAAAVAQLKRFGPDLVHIHHLNGLTADLVHEARCLGAAVVVTLHDFAPLCALGQLFTLAEEVCPGPTPRRCLGCVGAQVALPPGAAAVARRASGAGRAPVEPLVMGLARPLVRGIGLGRQRVARRLEAMRAALEAADLRLAPSRFLRDRYAALGVSGIEVLANGREPLAVPPLRRDPGGPLRVGFLGSAIPSKGLHVLADALRRLDPARFALRVHGAFPSYHGDDGYEARVRRLLGAAAETALRGPFPRQRLAEVLGALDVVVVPSLWEENAPLVVQEAFQARRPVVASRHGGLAETVADGVSGLLVRPGDADDLARALRRLAGEAGLLETLAAGAPPVPPLAQHLRALEARYAHARERHRARAGRLGVVVVDRGRPEEAAAAARSALDPTLAPKLIVVENGPGPEPVSLPEGVIRLTLPENRGFAGGVNAGLAALRARGCDRVLLLNNDARLVPGALRRLAEALEDPALAAVGPVVLDAAGARVESAGLRLDPRLGRMRLRGHGRRHEPREGWRAVDALSGAALLVRSSALDGVGAFDEGYFHSFEDADWCLRARRLGLGLALVRGALVLHVGGQTLGREAPDALYYAARNHLRAVERLHPLPAGVRALRRAAILALNLGHALLRGAGPRAPRLEAVRAGWSDFRRGRFGPREDAA